ncbi:MAG TPA: DUF481 domain-containing protein [Steroidobacteraceae bacterium]|nr:DUF481 domain-containing protein [Steroidobacteraceae bacterium]
MRALRLSSALLCLLPLLAWADDSPPPPQGVWSGKGQLGFFSSQGNAQAESANAALDMSLLEDPWKHSFHLEFLYGKSADVVAAERYLGRWESDYNLSDRVYTFGALRYEHDLFSGFDFQASGTAGVGYKIFDTKTIKLSFQVGAGYLEERPEVVTQMGTFYARTMLPSTGNAVATAGLNYSQQLTSTTTLADTFLVEAGADNSLLTDTLSLTVKMSTKLALSLAYNLQDNTKPPAGVKSIDSTETLNLVYAF